MHSLPLSLRQRKLLHFLQHNSGYITGEVLAAHLNVSARTIRNDVTEINQILTGLDIRITSKRSSGYMIEADNETELNELNQTSSSFLSREDRIRHITFRLCLSDEPINLYDLEDEMFISHTTLEHDLDGLRKQYVLPEPHIEFHRFRNTICFGTDERKRRIILNRLFTDNWNYNARGNAYYQYQYLEEELVNQIMPETQRFLQKYNILMEDINMVILNLSIAIAYYRISTGHALKDSSPIPYEESTAVHAAQELMDSMEEKLDCSFSYAERKEIYLHVSCSQLIDAGKLNFATVENYFHQDILKLTNDYIQEIDNVYHINFADNEDFYITLLQYLRYLSLPVHNLNRIQVPTDVSRANLLIPYEIAFLIQPLALNFYGYCLDSTELLYLSFCISGALSYTNRTAPKLKTVVMSHLNLPSNWELKHKLLSKFDDYIDLISLLPVYVKDNYDFSKIDLIVTTTTKKITDDPNCKTMIVSPFLSLADQEHIDRFINQRQIKRLSHCNLPPLLDMLKEAYWHECLEEEHFLSVIELLAHDFINQSYVPADYLTNILQRESILSFAFCPSIVFMYSIIPSTRTCLSAATLKHRIRWNGYKVRTVIMAAIRPEDTALVFRMFNDLYYRNFSLNDTRFLKTKQELLDFLETRS